MESPRSIPAERRPTERGSEMNRIKVTAAVVGLAVISSIAWFYRRAEAKGVPVYRTAPVVRATLKSTVSATGSLSAVQTVQVGTQVSGQVAAIYVEFNDHVKKGQLLARIDPTLQQQAVEDAQAQLERAEATLTQAKDEFDRNQKLFDARVITASEFGTVQSNFAVQQATVKSARIALDRAKQNLEYTSIHAPIDGVIVQRNVDPGQTVAASLSAPQLFLIANDLSEMQILAQVDESDIGLIKTGLPVQFTVQSYAGQTFSGTVQQVRLQSTTQDNVVNYTTVISVKNSTGKLLPGMTATVRFLTGEADNVLTVPNAALRVKPTAEMLAKVGPSSANASGATTRPVTRSAAPGDSTRRVRRDSTRTGPSSSATLWVLGAKGAVTPVRVRTGLTDGSKTEIQSTTLTEGTQVVIGTEAPGATATPTATPASSPFQTQGGGRRPGGF
jgi:HlyD family secretion protein